MKINASFTAKIEQEEDAKGAWAYVIWPESIEFFGTRGAVKVKGRIDGKPFHTSFIAMGGGAQMMPIKAETRKLLGKGVGDTVHVELEERLGD